MENVESNRNVWNFVSIPPSMESEEKYFRNHLGKYVLVKDIIEKANPETILDIGVGTGIFYSLFKDLSVYKIYGIEFVSNFIPLLQKRGITGIQCNIEKEKIPFEDASFDFVICDSILEHTLNPKHLFSEINRVLKPNGHFVVVVPNGTSALLRWSHLRGRNIFWPLIDNLHTKDYLVRCSVFYSEDELKFAFRESNLKIDKIDYINETSRDLSKIIVKILRFIGLLLPRFRDVVIATGSKNTSN
jgi:ubiquinone/menaquinone biosynthesis C-methylase UbiE